MERLCIIAPYLEYYMLKIATCGDYAHPPFAYFDGVNGFLEKTSLSDINDKKETWQKLESLSFRGCIQDGYLPEVYENLSRFERLRQIMFFDIELSLSNVRDTLEYLSNNRNTQRLTLVKAVLCKEAVDLIFASLRAVGLRYLNISREDVQERSLENLLHLGNLKELHLSSDTAPRSVVDQKAYFHEGDQTRVPTNKRALAIEDFKNKKPLITQQKISQVTICRLERLGLVVRLDSTKYISERCVFTCHNLRIEKRDLAFRIDTLRPFLGADSYMDKEYLFERMLLSQYHLNNEQCFSSPDEALSHFLSSNVKKPEELDGSVDKCSVKKFCFRVVEYFRKQEVSFQIDYFESSEDIYVVEDKLISNRFGHSDQNIMTIYQRENQFYLLTSRT